MTETLEEIFREPFDFCVRKHGRYSVSAETSDEAIDRLTNSEFLSRLSEALEKKIAEITKC